MWCPSCAVTEIDDEIDGECFRVRFATGGWSGAEELIEVVLAHFWMRHFHVEWQRGGLYIFHVPKRYFEEE